MFRKFRIRKDSAIDDPRQVLSLLLFAFCTLGNPLQAQLSYNVLFLGNSYTYLNDLPQMTHDAALSAGDTLIFDSNTPGGYQLDDHNYDVISKNKVMAGGWDYVVIQGQSQEPITLTNEFNTGGSALNSRIKQYNPCAETITYMTWGRKNGDAANCLSYPLMCTYRLMDSTIRSRYQRLTANIQGEVSPVSVVWRYLRQNHPAIELYQPDESHPSLAGTYAAACCFYATLFKKDPTLISYNPGLSAGDAAAIRNAAKTQVFDQLSLWNYKKLPVAVFGYEIGPGVNEAVFHPNTVPRQTYLWDFGDGSTSSAIAPTHSYAANGTYTVSLTTSNCDVQGLHTASWDTIIQFCSHTPTIYTSHAWLCHYDTLWTQPADSYQWYCYGRGPLPETNRFLPDYIRYNTGPIVVVATVNGCSELSRVYTGTGTPEYSGYYFDLIGDPCKGDVVPFAVLHINGFLSGSENILWYKNGTLLTAMTNEDTLLISTSGKYECKVVNPSSHCFLDTTSYAIEYKCDDIGVGIEGRTQEASWTIAPNPASETITLHLNAYSVPETVQIYNAIGSLMRSVVVTTPVTELHIAGLSSGLYYIRLKNHKQPALKFMKL